MSQIPGPLRQQPASSELAAALGACRRAFFAIALFSGMSNILMLAGALFMLEIYDRVLPSRSVPTLVGLLILVTGLYGAQGLIDMIRSRILVRVGHSLDETMSLRVYDAIVRLPLKIGAKGDGTQPIRDLDSVRGFLSGTGPIAFFDLPWMPVYLAVCFLFHTYLGLTALIGAIILDHADGRDRGENPASDPQRRPIRRGAQLRFSKQAGATPRRSRRWAWPAASPSAGTISIAISWRRADAPATSAAVSARFRRCCGCCCNPRFWRSAHGSSSIRPRRRAS